MVFSLYLGPYQPFLENQLLETFQDYRKKEPFAPVTVLVPNFLLVGHLRRTLAERAENLFNLQVHTLRHYLESFVEESVVREGFQTLPDVLAPWILKEVARPILSKGTAFRSVMETPGFYPSLRSTLRELRESLVTPEMLQGFSKSYQKAVNTHRLAQKLSEFAEVSAAYREWKKKGRWLDQEDSYFKALEVPPSPEGKVWIYGFYDASALQKKVLRHLTSGSESAWFIPYEEQPAYEYAKPFVDWARSLGKVRKEDSWEPNGKGPLQRLQGILFHGKNPWMDHLAGSGNKTRGLRKVGLQDHPLSRRAPGSSGSGPGHFRGSGPEQF